MVPSFSTRRAGKRQLFNHSMAASPWTMAAVDAVLASRQVAATTVTVRNGPTVGRLVFGSMMWWSSSPPRDHRRTVVLEVATPPAGTQLTAPARLGRELLCAAARA